jgi:hypothetical protein
MVMKVRLLLRRGGRAPGRHDDPVKAKGLAPLAAKTDKIDAYVLAELARRDLVPEIWLPTPGVREEGVSVRELARRHGVHRRAVRQALACAVPPPRKPVEVRAQPAIGPAAC